VYKEKLAKNLKQLIGERTIYRVSKEIGMEHRQLSRYVRGEQEIGLENLIKLADYFDEDLDILTGRKEY